MYLLSVTVSANGNSPRWWPPSPTIRGNSNDLSMSQLSWSCWSKIDQQHVSHCKIRGPKKGTWPDTLSAIHAAEPTLPGIRPNLAAPWWKHQHGWHQKTAIQWICAKRGPFRDSRDLTARRQCVQQTTVEHQQHLWNIFEAQRIAQ